MFSGMRPVGSLIAACCALVAVSSTGTSAPPIPAKLANNIHVRWGYPGGSCELLVQPEFIICEDVAHRIPQWVGYHLARADLHGSAKRKNNFHADSRLVRGARA